MRRGYIILGILVAVVLITGIAGLHMSFLLLLILLAGSIGAGFAFGERGVKGSKRKGIRK